MDGFSDQSVPNLLQFTEREHTSEPQTTTSRARLYTSAALLSITATFFT